VDTTSVSKETLNECPMAYKTMDNIVNNFGPTADIMKVIQPIYNFKAGEEYLRKILRPHLYLYCDGYMQAV